ncbi:MAG: TolC family protein [Candidatus Electryoneaceae bacterium]|nr:TolC family protein [Candidatus Electryoneaceae bacterium]
MSVKSTLAEPWTVIDAVQSAISTHPRSIVAEAIIEEAKGERRSDLALSAPVLSTRWDDIPENSRLTSFTERRIGISQDFEFPLRYIWVRKAANLRIDQAQSESRAILLDLESEIRLAYLEAWATLERVKILEEYQDSLKTYMSHIQLIGEAGGISGLDVRRSRVEVIDTEYDLRAYHRSMVAAFERLERLTGYDLTGIELISPLETDPVDTTRIAETYLFESNPEILITKNEIDILGYEKILASNAWLPELEFTYFQRRNFNPGDPNSWAFEVEMTIPIWFWSGGVGGVQISKAQLKGAKAELATYHLELSTEYSRLVQEVRSAYDQYEFYRCELLPLAKDEYLGTQQIIQLGDGTFMDLIKIQDDLKDIQLVNIDVISDLYEKKISLDRLSGVSITTCINQSP